MVRAKALRDVVAGVPYQCGFHPERSVVVLSLRGPRQRVGLVTRLDLPTGEDLTAVVERLAELIERDEGNATMVLIYDELPWDPAGPPHQHLLTELLDQLSAWSIPAVDALYVRADRFWSYQCSDERCCPAAGRSVADAKNSPVAAAYVMAGLAPLPDRAALVARVQPTRPLLVAAVTDSTWRWLQAFAADDGRGVRPGPAPAGRGGVRHRRPGARGLPPRAGHRNDGAGRAAVAALQSVPVRDAAVLRFCRAGVIGAADAIDDLGLGLAGRRGRPSGRPDPGEQR